MGEERANRTRIVLSVVVDNAIAATVTPRKVAVKPCHRPKTVVVRRLSVYLFEEFVNLILIGGDDVGLLVVECGETLLLEEFNHLFPLILFVVTAEVLERKTEVFVEGLDADADGIFILIVHNRHRLVVALVAVARWLWLLDNERLAHRGAGVNFHTVIVAGRDNDQFGVYCNFHIHFIIVVRG